MLDNLNFWVRYKFISYFDKRGMYRTGDAIWQLWRVIRKPLFLVFS